MYHHPEMTGAVDCKHDIVIGELDNARERCCDDLPVGFSYEFIALAELIMEEGLRMPTIANEAQDLYMTLVNEIDKLQSTVTYVRMIC